MRSGGGVATIQNVQLIITIQKQMPSKRATRKSEALPTKPIDPEKWKAADKKKRERMLKAALGHNKLEWKRDRGHPDAILRKWEQRLRDANFKRVEYTPGNSPDGGVITHSNFYQDPFGNTAEIDKYYGPTKDYNRFRVTVKVSEE